MAEAATIARPYAKAAFMAARAAKELPAWSRALAQGAALAADARIEDLVTNPRLGLDQVVSMFAELGGGTIEAHWQNFVRLLAQNKRLHVLPDIAVEYEALRAGYENEMDVDVTSAVPMDDAQQARLAAALKARFKHDVRLRIGVDPKLLGGAVIRTGDLIIDGSIQGRLQRLATELSS